MALEPGKRLGPYEILSPLGAGGMGEVYKARDTRLDRFVAIKVLPDHIAQREDARARFEREARAVASLNHPHICTLYDIGPNYMVMELIEGETLAARIEQGALPLDGALRYAVQIADALDRAHRTAVTHRDIKPHNIMLTRDGAKILDFGLAKSAAATPGPTEATLTKALTLEGTVVGTPQYMAPEQFEGKEADARSDIWAFGAVLYEMVTGRKAFEGKSYSSLVGAILASDPAPMAVKPFTPAWLERLVRRCLQKDPEDRYHCMRDLVIDLKSPPAEAASKPAKPNHRWQAATAVSIAAALLFAALWQRKTAPPPLPVATEIAPPQGTRFPASDIAVNGGGSAISPDGQTLAYVVANEKGEALLYVRPLDSLTARALPGTEGAALPFWSPDGKSLAFFAQTKLKRIDLSGGSPVTLCYAGGARGGDWNNDGVIVFGSFPLAGGPPVNGIQRVPASGGTPVLVTRIDKEATLRHYYPQFLPGGREFLYLVRHRDENQSGIAIGSIDRQPDESKPAEIVAQTEYTSRYHPASGRLLYIQGNGTLMARQMDLNPIRLMGDPVPVAEGVRTGLLTGQAEFSLSRQGTLVYRQATDTNKVRFGWRDRMGKSLEVIGEPIQTAAGSFALSPDETRVAYHAGAAFLRSDVWVMDLTRALSTRISLDVGLSPRWSPDGKFLYYNNARGIHRKAADGSGEEVLLAKTRGNDYVATISPDGNTLLFGGGDIMKLALTPTPTGDSKAEEYLKTSAMEMAAAFSPDGRWVAYVSNESGRFEIYIQEYPSKRGKWQVSASGGSMPAWRKDGRELYWAAPDGILMAAPIDRQGEAIRPGRPQPLFRLPVVLYTAAFQPARDGQRFLVYEPASATPETERMVVIQNWAARLGK